MTVKMAAEGDNRQVGSGAGLGKKLVFLPTTGCDLAYSVTFETIQGTFLLLQCLRLQAPSLGGPGSIPGQESGTSFHPHHAGTKNDAASLNPPRWRIPQLEILRAATRIHVLQLRTGAAK